MTIAMGINFGKYVLLAADTRVTRHDWDGHVIDFHDDSIKIQKTDSGLITGAGFVELLDSVKYALSKQTITSTNQIIRTIREETNRCYTRYGDLIKQHVEKTGWIFSYMTFDEGVPRLRLAISHAAIGEGVIGLSDESDPVVIYPVEATKAQANVIRNILKEGIKPLEESETYEESFQRNWPAITGVIRASGRLFSSVSPYLQIGIHTIEHVSGISPIVKDTDEGISLSLG